MPGAILFDLGFPGRRMWTGEPPYRFLGRNAVAAAAREFSQGNAGAGWVPPPVASKAVLAALR